MPRTVRVDSGGAVYHVINRANGRVNFNNLASTTGNTWFDNFHFFTKQNTKVNAPPPTFTGIYDSTGTSTASARDVAIGIVSVGDV